MYKGQIHVYFGDGKGKTTAAAGLALRAAAAGMKVYIGQFIKDIEYGEIRILKTLPGVETELYGTGKGCLIGRSPSEEDLEAARSGLLRASEVIRSGAFDMVILDEIMTACSLGLLGCGDILALMDEARGCAELVLTGRGCPQEVIDGADLATEMKEIRHYYISKGLEAREGIER